MQNHLSRTDWYIICNPTSGGGIKPDRLQHILDIFKQYSIDFEFVKTQYAHHEKELVQKAIQKGYVKFVCMGGDGTIHHMINGIMSQHYVKTDQIKMAVIPTGTGNDWVRHHKIPSTPKKAIYLLVKNNFIYQDIGKISLTDCNTDVYFNNAAGIGFDAFVVKQSVLYRKWGSLAYLISALKNFKRYALGKIVYTLNSKHQESYIFLISIGICRYSGGGMQLTDFKNHKNGFFDVTIIRSIRFYRILSQIINLYNGNIAKVKEVHCTHATGLMVHHNSSCFIQADGELIGKGKAEFNLIPKAIQFIIC